MLGIDLFSGAGGMSLGATWAGVDVKAAIELHSAAAGTIAKNHRHCLTIQGDIRHIGGLANLRNRKDELVVFGGPPVKPSLLQINGHAVPKTSETFFSATI